MDNLLKVCSICKNNFETKNKRKNVCSFECKQEKVRQRGRELARQKRILNGARKCEPCVVCGYSETTDLHHEGKKTYILCPNHHALITRNIKTIKQVLLIVDK